MNTKQSDQASGGPPRASRAAQGADDMSETQTFHVPYIVTAYSKDADFREMMCAVRALQRRFHNESKSKVQFSHALAINRVLEEYRKLLVAENGVEF